MLKVDLWNVIFVIINLLVLYVIMRLAVVKPIKKVLDKRADIIKKSLNNAAVSESNAKALETELNKRFEAATERAAEFMTEAKDNASHEYNRIVEEAKADADRIVKSAHKTVTEERTKVLNDLQSQIADIAIDTTKKVLENSDLKSINNSLYEKFLTEDGNEGSSN